MSPSPNRHHRRLSFFEWVLCLAVIALISSSATAEDGAKRPLQLALTLDDLPWVGAAPAEGDSEAAVQRIAAILNAHNAPATGFVVCQRARENPAPVEAWVGWGLSIGNHSERHRDLNATDLEAWLEDIRSCDTYLERYGEHYDHRLRFPYLHRGDTRTKRDGAASWLDENGIGVAPVSVDTSDWILTRAHAAALATGNAPRRRAVGEAFIAHVRAAVQHADEVAQRKMGRRMPHILLLHFNSLVDDYLDELLLALHADGVEIVSLDTALQDPAYARDDVYIGSKGLSWLYRMHPASREEIATNEAWDDAQADAIRARFTDLLGDPPTSLTRTPVTSETHAEGLDDEAIAALLADAGSSERWRSLLVRQDGEPMLEAYFNGTGASSPANLKSVTKSLVSLLVGVAIGRGDVESENERVDRYLPEIMRRYPDKRDLTLRELLTMSSGIEPRDYTAVQRQHDWVEYVLSATRASEDRARFRYDTPVLQILAASLRAAGRRSLPTLADDLLRPLGHRIAFWRPDPTGLAFAGNDAYLTPAALLALGQLLLDEGRHGERQLLPSDYLARSFDDAIEPATETINHGTLPVRGYGYLWWRTSLRGEEVIAALGHGGQMLLLQPAEKRVIVVTSRWPMTSSTDHYRHVVRVLEEELLPLLDTRKRSRGAPAS